MVRLGPHYSVRGATTHSDTRPRLFRGGRGLTPRVAGTSNMQAQSFGAPDSDAARGITRSASYASSRFHTANVIAASFRATCTRANSTRRPRPLSRS